MCDQEQVLRWANSGVSRRRFAAMGALASFAACAPMSEASAEGGLAESAVSITTPDGTMDAFFVHPGEGNYPAVILWPDIAGLREVKKMMARRLAAEGYAVLVANPYYRDVPAPQFADFATFAQEGGFQKVGPWREKLTARAIMSDARALIGWLDAQDAVDATRGVGTQGYCMGGPFTVWTAAGVPDRVKAACSFHGGGLVGDDFLSPINQLDDTEHTSYLIAIAKNDDAKAPDDKVKLKAVAEAADVPAEIEVYGGDHGWTVPDSPAYDEGEAERAWARLLVTYKAAL